MTKKKEGAKMGRPSTMPNAAALNMLVDPAMLAALDAEAEEQGKSRARLVREVLAAHLRRKKAKR